MTEDEAKNAIEKVLAIISRTYDSEFVISRNEIRCKYFAEYVSVWVHSGINDLLGCKFYTYNDMFDSLFKHHSAIEFYDKDNNRHLVNLSKFGSTIEEINIVCDLM